MAVTSRWDIFCAVVDNYGDIGVTWRLARQLHREYGLAVRLWVDDLSALARLWPETDCRRDAQVLDGVEVRAWRPAFPSVEPGDVVIEAFACPLPPSFVEAMAACGRRVLWLNLDYLSAESWVAGCHGLPSLQANGLQKYFFFPGFFEGTGGLIREAGLIEKRLAFQADPSARQAFLGCFDVAPAPGDRLVSLFAYENPAVPGWLEALSREARPTWLLVPEGRVLGDVARGVGRMALGAGEHVRVGSLTVVVLPFLHQDDYDRLLWSCDFNAVRGEDSFVRAQWAGRPFVWHIYPQAENAHEDKLWAFFERYAEGWPAPQRGAVQAFWRAWNGEGAAGEHWPGIDWARWSACALSWSSRLAAEGDLAGKLVSFHADWL